MYGGAGEMPMGTPQKEGISEQLQNGSSDERSPRRRAVLRTCKETHCRPIHAI
jgi:hypothetical protein